MEPVPFHDAPSISYSEMSTEHIERKFEGWAALDENAVKGQLKWIEYEPKQFAEDDLERESIGDHC